MKEYNVYGLGRSGNHVIIEWVSHHFNLTKHYNNIDISKTRTQFPGILYGDQNTDIDCVIYSYEEKNAENFNVENNTIIILRDFYNMISSRLKAGNTYDEIELCSVLWKKHAELYYKYPNNFILYNKWVTDDKYLTEIENNFGWNNRPRKTDLPVSKIGGGSSFTVFDKLEIDKVNKRYEQIKDIPDYEGLWNATISYPEINALVKDIFGDIL